MDPTKNQSGSQEPGIPETVVELSYDDVIEGFAGALDDLCQKYGSELVASDIARVLTIQSAYTMLGEVAP